MYLLLKNGDFNIDMSVFRWGSSITLIVGPVNLCEWIPLINSSKMEGMLKVAIETGPDDVVPSPLWLISP